MKKIVLKDLVVGYKNNILLDNVNTEFESGKVYGIIGKNGVGKSTFFKTVAKILEPISGQISLSNGNTKINLLKLSVSNFARYVSIHTTYIPDLGNFLVKDVVALGRSVWTNFVGILQEEDIKIINSVLDFFDLSSMAMVEFSKLSDGQKQKVLLARTIVQDTPIILLDEPTSFLDYKAKQDFFKKIQEYAKMFDKIVLISTHDFLYSKGHIDKFFLIDNKTIILYNNINMEDF